MKRIAVIGAGIAGLSAAYYVDRLADRADRPLDLVLMEKNQRAGGSIVTERSDGFVMEGGPDCFLSEKPWTFQLCRDIGIDDQIIGTNQRSRRTYILWRHKLHPLPEGFLLLVPTSFWPFVTSSFLTLPGKLRMAMDLILPRKESTNDETLAAFVRRRLGEEALERIAEPLVAGVHAGNPETMSLRSTFPRFIELEDRYRSLIYGMYQRRRQATKAGMYGSSRSMFLTLKDGLGSLVDTLTNRLRPNTIALGTEVEQITKVDSHEGTPRYRIVPKGDGPAFDADSVVIGTPSYTAAVLLESIDRDLARHLGAIPYVSTATINLAYHRDQIRNPLDGYGFVVPRTESRTIMATTFSSVKFADRAPEGCVLLRSFVGGAKNQEILSLPDDRLVAAVCADVKGILGIDGDPFVLRLHRWPQAMPQYVVGHQERIASIQTLVARHPGLYLVGSAYEGIGISDCIRQGQSVADNILSEHLA